MQISVSGLSEVTLPKDKYRSAALGLWEGLSHSASLRSIVIVLKSHSALLRSIVIVLKCQSASLHLVVIGLKVVATKTNDATLPCIYTIPIRYMCYPVRLRVG